LKPKEWTDEEVRKLRELYSSNLPFEEVARNFPGRTKNAIRLKASRLGIRRPYAAQVVQVNPIKVKVDQNEVGLLVKCDCGSWIRLEEDSPGSLVVSCKKCGSLYQLVQGL